MFNINLSNDKKILKKLIFLKILLKYVQPPLGQKPITISISPKIDTGLQAFKGYIYGLRMDLIGQFDGVGLHRAAVG